MGLLFVKRADFFFVFINSALRTICQVFRFSYCKKDIKNISSIKMNSIVQCARRDIKSTLDSIYKHPRLSLLIYKERRGFTNVALEQGFLAVQLLLTQSFNFSIHNVDMQCLRLFRKSRHTKDFSCYRHNHFRTVIDNYILDMEFEVIHRTINFRIGRE